MEFTSKIRKAEIFAEKYQLSLLKIDIIYLCVDKIHKMSIILLEIAFLMLILLISY